VRVSLHNVSLHKSGRSFGVAPGQSLLDAALGAGLNLPHSCKGGNCGSCRARLLQGEIYYPNGRPLGLSDAEVAEGFVLLCQARARGDVSIETLEITTPEHTLIKRLPARIERALPLSHDVMGLYLRLPAAEEFHFEAGQYIDIMLPGGRRRSFSIASPPHDSRLLELHVRRVEGGEFSAPLFNEATRGALLTIEGPLGQFVYRPRQDAGPMLLVGGGTGLAPLLSIIKHLIEKRIERPMLLYWGVRAERDLYAHAALEEMARRTPNLHYLPVLSEPSPAWRGVSGWIHEAVLKDIPDLKDYDVYTAGPPAMIFAVRRDFGRHGVDASRLYFDSFDYAPDAPPRQPMSAETKS
jgi:CDP-4-dehydro-6-deoxyglucose reductase, E3